MADAQLDDLQKTRISERLYALSDYHGTAAAISAIENKLHQVEQGIMALKSQPKGSTRQKYIALRRTADAMLCELKTKEEEISKLRFQTCKLCLFAAWGEVSLHERVLRVANVVVTGGVLGPLNRFATLLNILAGRLVLKFY